MRAATLRVRSHMLAVLRLFDLLKVWRDKAEASRHHNALEDDLTDEIKRDLGLMDGRPAVGCPRQRQSDEMREALLRQPRPL